MVLNYDENYLEHSDQADFLHRGLQGLRWKLDACALRKKSIPVAQDLSLCSDLSRASFVGLNTYPNNGKRLSLKGTIRKAVQPGTNWFSQCCDCMAFLPLIFLASAFCWLHVFKCDCNFSLLTPP